jgi:PAS domain S-box-containing protein
MKIQSLFNSLPAQLIVSFILVVILTAVTIGVPAIWLINEQLDQQAWSQVDQGLRSTETLYTAQIKEIENLAVLTAQRPTLRELLVDENWNDLVNYLSTLQVGAGLDLVIVCDEKQAILASTDKTIPEEVCNLWDLSGYRGLSKDGQPQVWLISTNLIQSEDRDDRVIIGNMLDDDFTKQMRDQTGLDQTLLMNGQGIASSLETNLGEIELSGSTSIHSEVETNRGMFELNGQPYYFASIPLNNQDIEAQVALSVAAITATQGRLAWILIASILSVAALGSALGAFLARRISQPLVSLAVTAEKFRKGDLSSEVSVDTRIREVKEVAQALEEARVELGRTLDNLEREKAWINHLLESIVEGIITVDSEGRITYFSEGAERITGWGRAEVLERSCDDIFKLPQMDSPFSQNFPPLGTRHKLVVELSGGRLSTLSISQSQLAPSEVSNAETVLVFRDISDEVVIHRLLGEFLANIAHEFRTPLSALAASIELLMDQAPDLSDEELKELLNSLHLGALGLQTLVDNLLESASIEAGHFRVSPRFADLGVIIARASQTMQPLLEKYRQHLVADIPVSIPEVIADSRRIEQVLVNLLSNASKFGPTDAKIKIETKIESDCVKVQVTDQGPGISMDQRERVFYRFTPPGPATDSAKVGAGLGLSVVKAVVEAHGGEVGVDDHPRGGAVFWFTLPIAREP